MLHGIEILSVRSWHHVSRLNYCYYAWPSYSLDGLRTVLSDLMLDCLWEKRKYKHKVDCEDA